MRLAALLFSLLLAALPVEAGERILALSPHACEILADVGAIDEIVGVVDYCDYPESLKSIPNLGGYNRIQVEVAMKLAPTLAIVMNDGTPAVNKLRALGVRVEASNPTTVDAMIGELERLGRLSGHEDEAIGLARSLRQRVARLEQEQPDEPLRVFYEIWPEPLITAGGTSLIDDVLTHLGLVNVFGDIAKEGPKVNVEAVVRAKPDLIIIPAKNGDAGPRRKFWKKWLGDSVRVIAIDADSLHRPTPRLIDGMKLLQQAVAAGG